MSLYGKDIFNDDPEQIYDSLNNKVIYLINIIENDLLNKTKEIIRLAEIAKNQYCNEDDKEFIYRSINNSIIKFINYSEIVENHSIYKYNYDYNRLKEFDFDIFKDFYTDNKISSKDSRIILDNFDNIKNISSQIYLILSETKNRLSSICNTESYEWNNEIIDFYYRKIKFYDKILNIYESIIKC